MWHLAGKLTHTVGAQLTTILDPLAKPRTSSIEDSDGNTTQIPDPRPQVQRLHDALDEACAKLLKSADQPSVGGIPASVVVTISLDDLLAKTGLADTADGSNSLLFSCSGSPTRPRFGPPSSIRTVSRWPSANPDDSPHPAKPWH